MNMDYICGWFDGEGTIRLRKSDMCHILSFPNTDLGLLEQIKKYLKEKMNINANITKYQPKYKNSKPMYRIIIYKQKDVIKLLEYFKEKCITKNQQSITAYNYEVLNYRESKTRWREEEIEYLRQNYPEHTMSEIARTLGRSRASIDHYIQRLGIRKCNVNNGVQEKE